MKKLIIVLLLAGCTSTPPEPSFIKTGEPVLAPYGFSELCQRENTPECGK